MNNAKENFKRLLENKKIFNPEWSKDPSNDGLEYIYLDEHGNLVDNRGKLAYHYNFNDTYLQEYKN